MSVVPSWNLGIVAPSRVAVSGASDKPCIAAIVFLRIRSVAISGQDDGALLDRRSSLTVVPLTQHFRRDRGFQTLRAFRSFGQVLPSRCGQRCDQGDLDAYVIHWNEKAAAKQRTDPEVQDRQMRPSLYLAVQVLGRSSRAYRSGHYKCKLATMSGKVAIRGPGSRAQGSPRRSSIATFTLRARSRRP